MSIVASTIPFVGSYLLLLAVAPALRAIAGGMLKAMLPADTVVKGYPRELAIDLSVSMYRHMSFFASWVLSGSMSASLVLRGENDGLLALVVLVLVVSMVAWLVRWSPLVCEAADVVRRGREMRIAAGVTTTLLLVLTVLSAGGESLPSSAPGEM